MPQDGNQRCDESFNSFLAGALLTRRCINNFDFFNLMNSFEDTYDTCIVSDQSELCVSIYLDDNNIKLSNDMDDMVCFKGKKISVRNYLYFVAGPRVREFFHISNLENNVEKKSSMFNKILYKRRRKIVI